MLMQNFGVTNKEHYGIMVCYGIFWSGQYLSHFVITLVAIKCDKLSIY